MYVLWLGLLVPEMVARRCGADRGRRDSADRIDCVGLLLPREDGSPSSEGAAAAAAPRRGFGGGRRTASSSFSRPEICKMSLRA